MRLAVLFLLTVFSVTPNAAETRYNCTIERAYNLGSSGLKRDRTVERAIESPSFVIERATGTVTGSILENIRFQPTVVAPGDTDNSFQIYWVVTGRAGSRLRFIEVQEFIDEVDKPFRAIVQNWTYTGHCV